MLNLLRLLTLGLVIVSWTVFCEDVNNEAGLNEGWYDKEFWENATPQDVHDQLAQGADPNDPIMPFSSPLHNAVWYNENPEIIIILLEAGAAVNARIYHFGTSALHNAAENNKNPEIITTLVKAGADASARDSISGETPLHYAAKNNKNPSVVTTLVKAGADVNARSSNGKTPLHEAASYNENPAMITTLIESGAFIDPLDRADKTPLHHAASINKNPAVITALVEGGADVNAQYFLSMSPLQLAASMNENPAIMMALVNGGAEINTLGSFDPPLHLALKFNNLRVVNALLKVGADPRLKDESGRTAFDLIQDNDNLNDDDVYHQLLELLY